MTKTIERTEDGSATLLFTEMNEHYHSTKGARTESQHIYIDKGLNASNVEQPHVLEIGFGTGLNALLTLETANREQRVVHYTTIERYPLTWEEVQPLGYSDSLLFKELHTASWDDDVRITRYFTLHKVFGDATAHNGDSPAFVLNPAFKYDVVYFDAFAPEKQPEMWSEQLFNALNVSMNKGGILTTYCAKGEIRRQLQRTGFKVERLEGPVNGKREILRAVKE
ncbi:MAG: tRNA (5-methylaminomethyl-2-thiouridine)(34)-methyltransferase MnmD [Mediterranea sp.]|jgi:tRNA U34 5-methylaminomethyl-2-thiouridine-forming methyltransferase MnmC|nr:tRNA (5-methylaminomethyl-2-thiouridine)(34)-methyltransferase MnmD [Mediterranea sp.]